MHSRYAALLPLLSAFLAGGVHAADYCVGTVQQLATALTSAITDGEDSVIKLRSGTYALTEDLSYQSLEPVVQGGRITLRGGYGPGCPDLPMTAAGTVLTGNSNVDFHVKSNTGAIEIEDVVFQGVHPVVTSSEWTCQGARRQMALRRLRVSQSRLIVGSLCHNVLVENSVFTNPVQGGSTGYSSDTSIGIFLRDNPSDVPTPPSLVMVNNTVSGGRVDIERWEGVPSAYLYNNIFNRPSGADVFSAANVVAMNNRYDGISFTGGVLVPGSGGNTSAAPMLGPDQVPVAGSPMINAGTPVVPDGLPTVDYAGNPRVVGASVDIGALESAIDGSGVFTVTNTQTSGNGSLGWALEQANNAPGFNRITFNIAGGCPRVIPVPSPLQVRETVAFDGWSQPGSLPNTSENGFNAVPCVVLSGNGTIGIETLGELGTGRLSARGLGFQGFSIAIALTAGTQHAIYGNQFGGRIGESGPMLSGNEIAVGVIAGRQTVIGGGPLSSRNLIGDSSDVGIHITPFLNLGGEGVFVVNNLIGVDRNGIANLPNGAGIRINGPNNMVRNNRISANAEDGILLSGSRAFGNRIENNVIGRTTLLGGGTGNGRMGVMVQQEAHDNIIGPDNIIARNGDDGVRVMPTAGGRNAITGNRISANPALGIDLGANGVSANDIDPAFCDPDLGCAANRGQNFPVIHHAIRRGSGTVTPIGRPVEVSGMLRSTVGGPYHVEVFATSSCDANGHGEGARMLSAQALTITTDPYCPPGSGICYTCAAQNCTEGFTVWLPEEGLEIGDSITTTATSPMGNTSEFSACVTLEEEVDDDLIFANGFQN